MKPTLAGTTVVMLAVVLAACRAAPAPEPKSEKWQYGELTYGSSPAGKQPIRWSTSTEKTEGEDWDDLAKKLKAPPALGADANHRLRVLDRLGDQGWELVDLRDVNPGAKSSVRRYVLTFKRRLAK